MPLNPRSLTLRQRFGAALAVLTFLLAGAVHQQAAATGYSEVPPQLTAMVTSAVDGQILPAYSAMAAAAVDLESGVKGWCETPGAEGLKAARTAFAQAVHSFARVYHVRFGPAQTGNRLQRIAFLPDPRGVVRRQVAKALASRDDKLLTVDAIAQQSAALQGLPALEQLLYAIPDGEDAAKSGHRCRLAAAVAGHVARLTGELDAGWRGPQGWRALMLDVGPGNAVYTSPAEPASDLMRALLTGLQVLREEVLLPWHNSIEAKKAWVGAPFERSGLSKDFVETAFVTLRGLHKALHLDLVIRHIMDQTPEKRWMKGWLESAYDTLGKDLGRLALPTAITSDQQREQQLEQLKRARFYLNGLRQVMGREIAPAAALRLGFNELDGD